MDSLVNKGSIDDFYTNVLMPLMLFGCGSINELLEMRMYELEELKLCCKDDDFKKQFLMIHGFQTK